MVIRALYRALIKIVNYVSISNINLPFEQIVREIRSYMNGTKRYI